jgi:hypothetical protein
MRLLLTIVHKGRNLRTQPVFVRRAAPAAAAGAAAGVLRVDDDTKPKVFMFLCKPNGQTHAFNANFSATETLDFEATMRRMAGLQIEGKGKRRTRLATPAAVAKLQLQIEQAEAAGAGSTGEQSGDENEGAESSGDEGEEGEGEE